MANYAVLASGSGSNFEAIIKNLENSKHNCRFLAYDKSEAFVKVRAKNLSIPAFFIHYKSRQSGEKEILTLLKENNVELLVLAGFMRLLSPNFLNEFAKPIINIHPSLLPKYPGTQGIEKSLASGDKNIGITMHYVDEGMDTGTIIKQVSIKRDFSLTDEAERERIHALEHMHYPKVIADVLSSIA